LESNLVFFVWEKNELVDGTLQATITNIFHPKIGKLGKSSTGKCWLVGKEENMEDSSQKDHLEGVPQPQGLGTY